MLGSLFNRKKEEVRRILHGRMNRSYLQTLDNKDRHTSRGAFCEVVWVIPVDSQTQNRDYDRVQTLVTRDISAAGLSLIHNRPVEESQIVVGLKDETAPRFIRCALEHCTALGYGHYLIGLRPEEVVSVSPEVILRMEQTLEQRAEGQELVPA